MVITAAKWNTNLDHTRTFVKNDKDSNSTVATLQEMSKRSPHMKPFADKMTLLISQVHFFLARAVAQHVVVCMFYFQMFNCKTKAIYFIEKEVWLYII